MLNLFIPSPLCTLLPVPDTGTLPLTLVVSFEPSTSNSWAGQCRAAATRVHILGYSRFEIWKYGECNKYVRLFRSEQEFGVSIDICEQIVYFDVLLTVYLSIMLVINHLDVQFLFIISLLYASAYFEDYVLISRRSKLYYTASGIITLCRWPSGTPDGHLQSVMIPDAV